MSEAKEVQQSEVVRKIQGQWAEETAAEVPQKYQLPKAAWKMFLDENKNPDKKEFYRQMVEDGVEVTEEKDIQMEQGDEEYKLTVKEWEFMAETVQDYRENNDCIWGPFTKEEIKNNETLKNGYIMPHFVRTTKREDGSLKHREVTDASGKQDLKICKIFYFGYGHFDTMTILTFFSSAFNCLESISEYIIIIVSYL